MNKPFSFLQQIPLKSNPLYQNLRKASLLALSVSHVPFLKMLNQPISPLLVILINESFLTGIFPDKLKIAKVIAIHKKGATDDPSNYRPISLLSVFSKIFEKNMHKRLYNFLEVNDILQPLQFGFRKNIPLSILLVA